MSSHPVDAALVAVVGLLTAARAGIEVPPGVLVDDVDERIVTRFLTTIAATALEASSTDGGARLLARLGLTAARQAYVNQEEEGDFVPTLDVGTAEDRAQALAARREEVRPRVANLRGQIEDLERASHDELVAGRLDAAAATRLRADDLRPKLTEAAGELERLEKAITVVGRERVAEQHRVALASAEQVHADELAKAHRFVAALEADLVVLQAMLRSAEAAEQAARAAFGAAQERRVALGLVEHEVFSDLGPAPVSTLTQGHHVWHSIRNYVPKGK